MKIVDFYFKLTESTVRKNEIYIIINNEINTQDQFILNNYSNLDDVENVIKYTYSEGVNINPNMSQLLFIVCKHIYSEIYTLLIFQENERGKLTWLNDKESFENLSLIDYILFPNREQQLISIIFNPILRLLKPISEENKKLIDDIISDYKNTSESIIIPDKITIDIDRSKSPIESVLEESSIELVSSIDKTSSPIEPISPKSIPIKPKSISIKPKSISIKTKSRSDVDRTSSPVEPISPKLILVESKGYNPQDEAENSNPEMTDYYPLLEPYNSSRVGSRQHIIFPVKRTIPILPPRQNVSLIDIDFIKSLSRQSLYKPLMLRAEIDHQILLNNSNIFDIRKQSRTNIYIREIVNTPRFVIEYFKKYCYEKIREIKHLLKDKYPIFSIKPNCIIKDMPENCTYINFLTEIVNLFDYLKHQHNERIPYSTGTNFERDNYFINFNKICKLKYHNLLKFYIMFLYDGNDGDDIKSLESHEYYSDEEQQEDKRKIKSLFHNIKINFRNIIKMLSFTDIKLLEYIFENKNFSLIRSEDSINEIIKIIVTNNRLDIYKFLKRNNFDNIFGYAFYSNVYKYDCIDFVEYIYDLFMETSELIEDVKDMTIEDKKFIFAKNFPLDVTDGNIKIIEFYEKNDIPFEINTSNYFAHIIDKKIEIINMLETKFSIFPPVTKSGIQEIIKYSDIDLFKKFIPCNEKRVGTKNVYFDMKIVNTNNINSHFLYNCLNDDVHYSFKILFVEILSEILTSNRITTDTFKYLVEECQLESYINFTILHKMICKYDVDIINYIFSKETFKKIIYQGCPSGIIYYVSYSHFRRIEYINFNTVYSLLESQYHLTIIY